MCALFSVFLLYHSYTFQHTLERKAVKKKKFPIFRNVQHLKGPFHFNQMQGVCGVVGVFGGGCGRGGVSSLSEQMEQ